MADSLFDTALQNGYSPAPAAALTTMLPAYTARLFQVESGGDPNAMSPGGRNRGLAQFGQQEEAQYGITDPTDPGQQATGVAREAQTHAQVLTNALGRQPTPGELYLSHQQGIAGGPALLTADPDTPAWQAIRPYYKSDAAAQTAIAGNLPKGTSLYGSQPTAGDFRSFWINKFEGGMAPARVASAAAPPAAAPVPAGAPVPPAAAAAPAATMPAPGIGSLAGGPGMLGGVGIPPVQSVAPQPGARLAALMMHPELRQRLLAAFANPPKPQLTGLPT